MSDIVNNVEKVKAILKVTDKSFDDYLNFCEENIIAKLLDRCDIETIPERLNLLIQEFLIEQYTLNRDGIGKGLKEISSVSDNNQTVQFHNIGGANVMSKNVDEFLNKKMSVIVKYRKLRW